MLLKIASKQLEAFGLSWCSPLREWPVDVWAGAICRLRGLDDHVVLEVPAGKGRNAWELHTVLESYGLPVARPVALAEARDGLDDLLVLALPGSCQSLEQAVGIGGQLANRLSNLLVHLHLAGVIGEDLADWRFALDGEGDALLLYGLGSLGETSEGTRDEDLLGLVAGLREFSEELARETSATYQSLWGEIAHIRLLAEPGAIVVTPRAVEVPVPDLSLGHAPLNQRGKVLLGVLAKMDTPRGAPLLRDIFRYHAWLEFSSGRKWPRALAANRWLADCFLPAISKLPEGIGRQLIGQSC